VPSEQICRSFSLRQRTNSTGTLKYDVFVQSLHGLEHRPLPVHGAEHAVITLHVRVPGVKSSLIVPCSQISRAGCNHDVMSLANIGVDLHR
jgi:hypothetical protein